MDYRFCKNCGAANKAGNRFCEVCGAMIDDIRMDNTGYAYGSPMQGAGGPAMVRKKSGPNLKVIIPAVLGVLLLIGGGVFAGLYFFNQDKEIDLLGDVDKEALITSGFDGEGKVEKVDKEVIKKRQGYSNMDEDVKEFLDSVSYECEEEGRNDLSNTDTVTITATFDTEKAKECGVKVVGGDSGKVEENVTLTGCFDAKPQTADSGNTNGSYNSDYNRDKSDTDHSNNNSSNKQYDNDISDEDEEISDEERALDDYAYDRVSDDYLTEGEISGFDKDEVQTWINYICAKNGYHFHDPKKPAKSYFESLDWYQKRNGTITDTDEAVSQGSDIEKENYKLLVKRRKELE